MLPVLLFATLLTAQPGPSLGEPDGSRTIGVVPPFHATPTPPDWVRIRSSSLAILDCKHYLYEAYADAKGAWLVRYLSFPEEGESYRELEQVFLYTSETKVKTLQITTVRYEPTAALYHGQTFKLVDRRDLMRP